MLRIICFEFLIFIGFVGLRFKVAEIIFPSNLHKVCGFEKNENFRSISSFDIHTVGIGNLNNGIFYNLIEIFKSWNGFCHA